MEDAKKNENKLGKALFNNAVIAWLILCIIAGAFLYTARYVRETRARTNMLINAVNSGQIANIVYDQFQAQAEQKKE